MDGRAAPAKWKCSPRENPPHGQLCIFQYGTLKALVKMAVERGHDRARLVNLARVRISENGYRVEMFPTLAEARVADAASKRAKPAEKACCPFCKQSDRLRGVNWTHEHPDGTEFIGPALICDRCDAIAPAGLWGGRGPSIA